MSKLPLQKRLLITANHKPIQVQSTPSPDQPLRSLGSFRLRFKSGSTVKKAAPDNATTATLDASLPDLNDQNRPTVEPEAFTTVDTVLEKTAPKEANSTGPADEDLTDPAVSIVNIFKARPGELRKYSLPSEEEKTSGTELKEDITEALDSIFENNGTPVPNDNKILSDNDLQSAVDQSDENEDSPQRGELGSLHTDDMQSTQDNEQQRTIQPVFISQEVEVELLQNNDTEAPLAEESLRSQSPVILTTVEQIHTPLHTDEQTQLVLEIEILDTRDEAEVENLQGSYDPLVLEHELYEAESLPEEESVIESNNHHHNVVPPPPAGVTKETGSEKTDDSFYFLPPEEEPVLSEDFQERAVRSITSVVVQDGQKTSQPKLNCSQHFGECCTYDFCSSKNSKAPKFTPEAHVASKQGFAMMRKLIYPGMPKIIQDVWVLTELAVTITQLVLAAITLSSNPSNVFNVVYFSITAIAFPLALSDSFLHFITLGSLASTVRYFTNKRQSKRNAESDKNISDSSHTSSRGGCWSPFSKSTKQQILEVLDFVRNWITDILLYPLVLLDLYDLIASQLYLLRTSDEQINFSLFIISAIFLILSVYLTRLVMIVTAALNLRRVPSNLSGSHEKIVKLSLWFLLHVFAQIIVHALIFVSLGMNIYLENTEFNFLLTGLEFQTANASNFMTQLKFAEVDFSFVVGASDTLNSSFYLIYAGVVGLFITQLGLVSFFIINYYHVRELSISFWVDMISMLQSENFAGLVFHNGVSSAKKRTQEIAHNIKYKKVREDLKNVKAVPFHVKLLYPFRIPVFVVLGVFYLTLFATFAAFLSITCIPVAGSSQFVCASFFTAPSLYSVPYFFTLAIMLLANAQVIVMVSLWLLVLFTILALVAIAPILLVVFTVLYLPLGCVALCVLLFDDLSQEMNVFTSPGQKITHLRKDNVRKAVNKALFEK